jgi:hypothetical protein
MTMTTSSIRDCRGAPALFVDGRPFDGVNYRSSVVDFTKRPEALIPALRGPMIEQGFVVGGAREPFSSRDRDNHAQTGRRGIHSHMVMTIVGHKFTLDDEEGWVAPDRYSYVRMDACLTGILEADPQAWLMPFAFLGTPRWWAAQHPDDLVIHMDEEGRTSPYTPTAAGEFVADPASALWRRDLGEALRNYIRHIRSQPYGDRVIGLHLGGGGCNEWYITGLSHGPAAAKGFRRWLELRYGSIDRLNQAWGTAHAEFTAVTIPDTAARNRLGYGGMRDPVRDRAAIDCELCFSDCVADVIAHFARIVKEETGGAWLVSTFHGYVNEFFRERLHDCGMLAMGKVLANSDVDILTAPDIYLHRKPGVGYPSYMNQVESVKLHNKVWLAQNDYRTYLDVATPSTHFYGRTDDEWGTVQQVKYIFLSDLTHACPTQFHDHTGWRYAAPALWETLGQCADIYRRSLAADRALNAEIAWVVDTLGPLYYGRRHPATAHLIPTQVRHLGHTGAPFGRYILEDLENIPPHKLWLFAYAVDLDDARIAALHTRLRGEGAVAVWLHTSGLINGQAIGAEQIGRVTGFAVSADETAAPQTVKLVTGETIPALDGKDSGPVFFVPEQPGVEVLGRYEDGRTAVALARKNGWTSVYSAVPGLPPGLLRLLAQRAGVHLYTAGDAALFANRSFIGVMSPEGGQVTIRMKEKRAVTDVFDKTPVSDGCREFTAVFRKNESKLFFLDVGQAGLPAQEETAQAGMPAPPSRKGLT